MILYNITLNVDDSVLSDWLVWMKDTHIPEVLQTGCFYEHKFLKLLNDDPEATGTTYAVQFFATNISALEDYLQKYAPDLQRKTLQRYSDRVMAFRTFLEEV